MSPDSPQKAASSKTPAHQKVSADKTGLSYIPLKNHSSYSLLEGAMSTQKLVETTKARGVPAVGLTDSGHLFGAMEFSLKAKAAGIKPILGCLLPVFIHGTQDKPDGPYPLPLFVQNQEGYQNLCQLTTLTTLGQEEALHGGVTLAQLTQCARGLIAFSGGLKGPIEALCAQDMKAADALFLQLKGIFEDRFYVELERYDQAGPFEAQLIAWAMQHKMPLVATNEAFFVAQDDYAAHDALLCIQDSTYVNVEDRRRVTPHHRLKTAAEMQALFADVPEALLNTLHVATRCSFMLEEHPPLLPPYPVAKDTTQEKALRCKAEEGLAKRLLKVCEGLDDQAAQETKALYEKQLAHELGVIHQMGFDGYFLIVADFIQWAKDQKIPVGPGRGSGAGSLVAFALRITDVDPMRFQLLFERFLNPERVSMPDFDIDFCPERREEVIAYVQQKYGADTVAHIITFGKLQARAVLRDVGRVLGMPYGQVDKLTKRIPFSPTNPMSLAEVLAQDEELRKMCDDEPIVKQLFDYAQKLEGLYRHASTHAAGVVIGDQPLVKRLPLYKDPKSALPATGFSMKYVEGLGLVKFDFLGLKNLTVIQGTIDLLKTRDVHVDIDAIPLDDAEAFKLLRAVKVVGLFQLESAGMRDVLAQLQPEAFEEIIALVALYRPGPMDDIPYYIACRHGREKVTYPYDCLEDILKPTFGVMVYQEQVLKIAQVLAGYSLGQADLLRRAMGKKIKKEMDAQRKIFIEGVLKNVGGPKEKASQLFDQIAKFAGYAFVKAHATPYALITYQTAYLKANYPLAFMTSLLNQDRQNIEKLAIIIQDVKDLGLKVLPPDINRSSVLFAPEATDDGPDAIRYGLAALKNVGEGAMEVVVHERTENGPFKDIFDFIERLGRSGDGAKALNKRQMEHLIWAGAFDSLNANRQQLIVSLEMLLSYGSQKTAGPSLFAVEDTRPPLESADDYGVGDRLRFEYGAVGMYLGQHPLAPYQKWLKAMACVTSEEAPQALKKTPTLQMAGVLTASKIKRGKSGQAYAFLSFSDASGSFEVMVFQDKLAEVRELLSEGTLFLLTVDGRTSNDGMRLLARDLKPLEKATHTIQQITITLQPPYALEPLHKILAASEKGAVAVRFCFKGVQDQGQVYTVHASLAEGRRLSLPQLNALFSQDFDVCLQTCEAALGAQPSFHSNRKQA